MPLPDTRFWNSPGTIERPNHGIANLRFDQLEDPNIASSRLGLSRRSAILLNRGLRRGKLNRVFGRRAARTPDSSGFRLHTVSTGQLMTISALDTTALDVISFDLVPERQSYILVATGGVILLFRSRNSREIGLRCCAWIARRLPKLLALCRPPRAAWRT